MRSGWKTGRATAAIQAFAVVMFTLLLVASSHAAIIDSFAFSRDGAVSEIRFHVKGRLPRLSVSAHGNELWIDLANAHFKIPPRPSLGPEAGPIQGVEAIDRGGFRSRLVVRVSAKTDYAVATRTGAIVLRVAPSGKAPNLASPLLAYSNRRVSRRPGVLAPHVAPTVSPPSRDAASPAAQVTASHPEVRQAPVVEIASSQPTAPALRRETAPVLPASRETASYPPAQQTPGPKIASAEPAAPALTPRESVPAQSQLAGSPLVLIDPGHGGYDPGTESALGVREKDLALEISRRVALALRARGARVGVTRGGDYFVPLPDRISQANRAGADLFVSIHLNSSPNGATTGIEVYYLDNTTDRATIRLAQMENTGAIGTPDAGAPRDANLDYILADLRQNYKAAESASLARMIDAQAAADLNARFGLSVNALGAKKGPFYVLVGARMPAVLVECGFLSNPDEARRLSSPQYQEILADAISAAIAHYLSADAAVGNL